MLLLLKNKTKTIRAAMADWKRVHRKQLVIKHNPGFQRDQFNIKLRTLTAKYDLKQ